MPACSEGKMLAQAFPISCGEVELRPFEQYGQHVYQPNSILLEQR
jgi:hypothetical protein